jgi:Xaa-Pro aminopeptidase
MTPMSEIDERREQFMSRIKGGAAIFVSAPVAIRNGDVEHEYRQDTDFYYLTGFEEPNAVAVLVPDHPDSRFVLFVQPKDPEKEVWTGWRAGEAGAVGGFGANAAHTIDQLDKELPKLLTKVDRIYYRFGSDPAFDERIVRLMPRFQRERQRNGAGPTAIVDPGQTLHELRLVKDAEELARLERAVEITCKAHREAMKALKPGLFEYELEAVLSYVFLRNGSRRPGYASIVASGPNATVLHYTSNKCQIREDDLVLIDAGAEFDYFTGDVTRTIPASGKFSEAQAQVYEIVLAAQLEAISTVRPGAAFIEPHDRAVRVLTEGLIRLGVLKGEPDKLIEDGEYQKYYMHRTSHWLGMDVHDAGPYKEGDEWRRLAPGMVLTIEPGLYFGEDDSSVPSRYRGIGIRIEDDVLVLQSGNRVLSEAAPKTIAAIEALMEVSSRD